MVDDDPDVLESVGDLIEFDLDYQVLTAPDGMKALDILRGGQAVDVVLSDFRMPGMDGCRFLQQAQRVRPDLPCLLMSAYPTPELEQELCGQLDVPLLRKPVDPDDLGQALKHAVSG